MKTAEINIRDPFVLVYEGNYYMYGTRGETCWGAADGFDVYISADMENWQKQECFHNDGSFWADQNYWAPEVYQYKGAFYMFASFKKDGVNRGTNVLRAESPVGPFVPWSSGNVTPNGWECLDGTLYVSPHGKPYMVFCHEWTQVGDGEICRIPLKDDLSGADGEAKLLFHASEAQPWIKTVHHKRSGIDGYVTDGPFCYRASDGTLFLLWSSFSAGGYALACAKSSSGDITGDFTQKETPVFEKDGGHGMLFRTLDGQLMLTLHSPNEKLLERPKFIQIEESALY
ncbi:MAG: glycoside hydrolase family 43 protein [Eubacteriales bacterium]|nr:glycoside hydrolase family 43 protein [Eubacteriales bacterium]MDD3881551.1 glycoside hydrolase family 43 protein [Eubacteriales bacterium]MDD4513379.1 glycoside hydrolase family 43 protein [Eubacteriales bacterium]